MPRCRFWDGSMFGGRWLYLQGVLCWLAVVRWLVCMVLAFQHTYMQHERDARMCSARRSRTRPCWVFMGLPAKRTERVSTAGCCHSGLRYRQWVRRCDGAPTLSRESSCAACSGSGLRCPSRLSPAKGLAAGRQPLSCSSAQNVAQVGSSGSCTAWQPHRLHWTDAADWAVLPWFDSAGQGI